MMAFLAVALLLVSFASSQSKKACIHYSDEDSCNTARECSFLNNQCVCTSDTKLDVLFGVDTSGSITYDGFQIQKAFIHGLVETGLSSFSRVGFAQFDTKVNMSRNIQFWSSNEALTNYSDGLYWTAGWTNTAGLLIEAMNEFDASYDAERHQIMLMITDGNPCLPDSLGDCPQSMREWDASYATYESSTVNRSSGIVNFGEKFDAKGITSMVIGIGDGLNTQYIDCLWDNNGAYVHVDDYDSDYFDAKLDELSEVLCPIPITNHPTDDPTTEPTVEPTSNPSVGPTRSPLSIGETFAPSKPPSNYPTIEPSAPSAVPTPGPTVTLIFNTNMSGGKDDRFQLFIVLLCLIIAHILFAFSE